MRFFKKIPLMPYGVIPDDQHSLVEPTNIAFRLTELAFRSIDDTADELSAGFVNAENYRKTNCFPLYYGEYTVWQLRMDKRTVPAKALKRMVEEMAEEAKRESGRAYISKERMKEIREQCKLRLLSKLPAVPDAFPVILHNPSGLLLLGAKTKQPLARFKDLAERLLVPQKVVEFTLQSVVPGVQELLEGSSFLTWLYSERESGVTFEHRGKPANARLAGLVEVTNGTETWKAKDESGGDLEPLEDIIAAGKRVYRAVVDIEYGIRTYRVDLGSEVFPIRSVAVKPVIKPESGEDDMDGTIIEWADAMRTAFELTASLAQAWARTSNFHANWDEIDATLKKAATDFRKSLFAMDDGLKSVTLSTPGMKPVTIRREDVEA